MKARKSRNKFHIRTDFKYCKGLAAFQPMYKSVQRLSMIDNNLMYFIEEFRKKLKSNFTKETFLLSATCHMIFWMKNYAL